MTFPVSPNSMRNHIRIGACLDEASISLASETGRPWALSRDHHHQMSNRFAWAWKLTELGVPVVLVYLGFLGCDDMAKNSAVIATDAEWEQLVRAHSAPIAPPDVWGHAWRPHGRAFAPLIRKPRRGGQLRFADFIEAIRHADIVNADFSPWRNQLRQVAGTARRVAVRERVTARLAALQIAPELG